jgi:phosphoglycerate dehydrogenase-like enzyme
VQPHWSHTQVAPYVADTEILLCFSGPMADHVVHDAPKLKWIQALGSGIDNIIDLPSLGPEVIVTNIRGLKQRQIHSGRRAAKEVAAAVANARSCQRALYTGTSSTERVSFRHRCGTTDAVSQAPCSAGAMSSSGASRRLISPGSLAIRHRNHRAIHGVPVSEATIADMLSLARDLPRSAHAQERRAWERWPAQLLNGKTVGILGVGLVAEYLTPICKAFNMKVVGISASPRPLPGFDRVAARDDLVTVAPELDYLVVLTRLTPKTRGIIGKEVFAALKPSAYLVNVARGGVVDEAALINALESSQIAGAVAAQRKAKDLKSC